MNWRNPLVLAALFGCCACAQAKPRLTVELLPAVEVTGPVVALGEVAHLQSEELPLMRKLVLLPVGHAPHAAQAAFVQRSTLAQWIRRETGVTEGEIEWLGADAVRVARAGRQLRGEELADAAREALRGWLRNRGVAGGVRVSQWPRDVQVPSGEVQLQARPIAGVPLRSRMLVWVDVWSGGAFVRTVPVALELTGDAEAGASPGNAVVPSAPTPSRVPPAAVLVERGGWATLRSTDGAVTLESRVAVLQDGRAGEHVRVRAPGGGLVFARVVGPAQLEVAP